MTMLFGEIYYLRSTEIVRRPSDILGLFQYAKRNRAEFTGRGVMLINNEVIEHIYDENSVENEIIEALRDNRVEVFYQPIYNTKTHKYLILGSFNAFYKGNPASCDLHPKLSKDGQYVVVDSAHDEKHHMLMFKLNWNKIEQKLK